jgi:hypothetical protein
MFPTTIEEVEGAFASAKNLNAALKSFLKREGKGGPQIASFAKDFRNAVGTGRPAAVKFFIEQNYSKREVLFVGLIRYVFPEAVESIVTKIFDTYADEFNTTYSKSESGVTLTNPARFKEISKSVVGVVEEGLRGAELPVSNFLKNSILVCVFESDVLQEVFKQIS